MRRLSPLGAPVLYVPGPSAEAWRSFGDSESLALVGERWISSITASARSPPGIARAVVFVAHVCVFAKPVLPGSGTRAVRIENRAALRRTSRHPCRRTAVARHLDVGMAFRLQALRRVRVTDNSAAVRPHQQAARSADDGEAGTVTPAALTRGG